MRSRKLPRVGTFFNKHVYVGFRPFGPILWAKSAIPRGPKKIDPRMSNDKSNKMTFKAGKFNFHLSQCSL